MNEIFELGLGVVPMTIVAFARESKDCLLFGADQQFTREDIRIFQPKLRQINNRQIVWGIAGNPAIGDDLESWLNLYDFANKDWTVFANDLLLRLSQLNGQRRHMAQIAGAPFKPEEMAAELLIAGWLSDQLRVYTMGYDGGCCDSLKYNFDAIGKGGKYAIVARYAIGKVHKDMTILDIFRSVMDTVSSHVESCLPPVDIWRITKNGIDKSVGLR